MRYFLFTDGASKGNPGPAGAGVALKDEDGNVLEERSQVLGEMTNNEAEYRALILGLRTAKDHLGKDDTLVCLSDSKLVVSQLRGVYKIKAAHLRELLTQVRVEEAAFKRVVYRLISRERNTLADSLANQALKKNNYKNK